MLKKLHWKATMFFSMLLMAIGFVLSVWAIETEHYDLSLLGIVIIIIVSLSWWVWVMLVIKKMLIYTREAINRAQEIKQDIKKVGELLGTKKHKD